MKLHLTLLLLSSLWFGAQPVRLYSSEPVRLISLNGVELVRQKVKLLSVMAGSFKRNQKDQHLLEYNIVKDIPSALILAEEWPTPIIYSGYEIGAAITYPSRSIKRDYNYVKHHPLAEAYCLFMPPPHNRPLWDLTSVLQAVRPDRNYFTLSGPGRVVISKDGISRFVKEAGGPHQYLIADKEQALRVRKVLVQLSSEPPRRCRSGKPPKPFGPVPSARQLKWQKMEFYGFIHFTVNTFTGKEWGYGDEDPDIFNPTQLDARQWARAARGAGMKGLIITAKHHDGFCLWPSKYTNHSVKFSSWRNGKGDVLKDLSAACKEFGLKMGVYLSPWDRNSAFYGKPAYITYYRNQIKELLTNYGKIFELWHDGANGGDGYYGGRRERRSIDNKTYYDWPNTWNLVRKISPETCIFSDAGPDIRWVGNERGYAPDTCWATIDAEGMYPGRADTRLLGHGTPGGKTWRPAEVDVSIRKGWFYHENQKPKSVGELLHIYYHSVGNGANLLLNIPPDKRGLIPEQDVKCLREFGAVIAQTFRKDLAKGKEAKASNVRGKEFSASKVTDGNRDSYWAADDDIRKASITVDLKQETRFNRIRIQEYIQLGQRISSFTIKVHNKDGWREVAKGTTIGVRRILCIPTVNADKIRLDIDDALACPTISTLELYFCATS